MATEAAQLVLGAEVNSQMVTPTQLCSSSPESAFFPLTWAGGVSLPVPGAAGLAAVTRRRSGVVLGRTGASSDRELRRAEVAQNWEPLSQSCASRSLKAGPEGVPAW